MVLMFALAGLISACTPTGLVRLAGFAGAGQQVMQQITVSTSAIGTRQADDPMTAVELYLRQYQPGVEPRLFQTTHIYDRNGSLLAELNSEGRRTWVTLPQISQHLIDATIATEDASFYANTGIDPARIAGAALQNFQQGEIVSGASTITMQLARNLFLPPEERYDPSVGRKARELGIAQELTALYTKDEILEMYLNLLNYGHLAYGPEAAAQVYFGKPASDLTLAEATLIAGIPQQPANLDPYENFDAARQRQRIVLDLMVRHGYLNEEEADRTFAEEIQLAGDPGPPPTLAPHFVQYVIENLDGQYGDGFTSRSGLNIYTSLDLDMQTLAQEIVRRKVAELRPRYDLSNAALVAMRPNSGEIMAMVGSADFDDATISGQVNVATSARQPGSAIKPVLYATALEDNLISPATLIWDTPVVYKFEEGDDYRPQNYDERFHGPVTVRTALANSYNVPAVKLLDGVGVERMLAGAEAMGIQSLDRGTDWYGLSLTLGGGEITLLELVTAFQTLASTGVRHEPTPVIAMIDSLGRTVTGTNGETNEQSGAVTEDGTRVMSLENAFLVSDILSDNNARTPAFGANSALVLSRPAAVKTGTTTDWRDNWTVGYTRYLSTGVWAGNSDGRPMRNASGITGAAPIWNEFMEAVLADPQMLATLGASPALEAWAFSPPTGVEMRDECPPGVSCRQGGEYFSQSWLTEMGDEGPLGDSVVDIPAAPVYAQSAGKMVLAGYCQLPGAIMRTVLSLSNDFSIDDGQPTNDGAVNNDATPPIEETGSESTTDLADDQTQTLAWVLRYGSHADLGPCESLQTRVDAAASFSPELARAGVRMFVDLQAAQRPETPSTPGPGTVPLAQVAAQNPARAFGVYALNQSIWHDYACPGQYVMGQILNRAGAPVAGIRVMARDEWGNVSQAVSKSGAGDYGWFDFQITSTTPHEIYVTVLDPAGNPASPTVTVQHRRGEGGDAPCHYLIFQGEM